MDNRMYPKRTVPKEEHCDHSYWAYASKGDDDAEKECFCDLDDGYCFGVDACTKRKESEW